MKWWKNKRLRAPGLFLACLVFIALARDFLANSRPLYCRIGGQSYYPAFQDIWKKQDQPYGSRMLDSIQDNFLWRHFPYEAVVFAPIPFAPGELPMSPDTTVHLARPGALHPLPGSVFRHWLGTDINGYDVAAGVVSGARVAILTGTTAMGLAFLFGMVFGAVAGFWGDDRLRIRRGQLLTSALGVLPALFYSQVAAACARDAGWSSISLVAGFLTFVLSMALLALLGKWLSHWSFLAKTVRIPADLLVMRFAELFTTIPALLVITAFAAMLPNDAQSLWALIALIGAVGWAGIARFVRAELLRVREMEYIAAARGMGMGEWRILFRHALPNALRPAYTAFAFGIGAAILLEAALSFLGYGDNSLHGATWGSLLQNARSNPEYWWICLPPGLAICFTILSLNAVGEALGARS